jgi:hypothetical protein
MVMKAFVAQTFLTSSYRIGFPHSFLGRRLIKRRSLSLGTCVAVDPLLRRHRSALTTSIEYKIFPIEPAMNGWAMP